MTYRKILKKGYDLAKKHGFEKEAVKLLVLELSGLSGASFLLQMDDEIDENKEQQILAGFERLIKGEPVQHIIGYSYFFGYRISVGPDVLIPRSETEELVGYVLSYYDDYFKDCNVDVADIGTGSGNIAIALKLEEPKMHMYATDISEDAIKRAKENAKDNNADVTFFVGNMLNPLIERNILLDILVSNPPYIPDEEYVEHLVLDNEPKIALFGGVDGMKFYEEIFKNASKILKPKAILAFEHSHTKKEAMVNLALTYFPAEKVISIKDLNNKDRFTIVIIGA